MAVLDASTATDRATLAKELTRAALMGARGNSGVIFSQILRGAAEALGEAGLLDAATIRRALRAASDAAYRAVSRPVEGTMLSVIRELAEEAEDPRNAALEPAALLKRLIERGEDALARTPDQLAVLREAGVVDAAAPGCSRSSAASPRRSPASRCPTRPSRTHTRRDSTRSTRSCPSSGTARSSWSRARTSTLTRSRPSSTCSATRCSSSGTRACSRSTSTPTSRARR